MRCAQLWPQVFGHVITALFVFQLFMVGILGVKQSYTSPVVVPLLFITAIFAMVCRGIFARPFQVMSLRGAVDLDKHEKVRRPLLVGNPHCLLAVALLDSRYLRAEPALLAVKDHLYMSAFPGCCWGF